MKKQHQLTIAGISLLSLLLASCGGGGGGGNSNTNTNTNGNSPAVNEAPTVTNVTVVDDNGGNANINDRLTASYTYNDAEGDVEGQSTFRWLRDGVFIDGATAETYTLVLADKATQVTCEVIPVAATGNLTGLAVLVAVRINIVRLSKLNIIRFGAFMMFLPIYYRIFFSVFQIKI